MKYILVIIFSAVIIYLLKNYKERQELERLRKNFIKNYGNENYQKLIEAIKGVE